MEAYSSSIHIAPVAVGGLVGHITSPGDGRFVGGCTGVARLDGARLRYVGGLVGHPSQPGVQRLVGGCVGSVGPAHHVKLGGRLHHRAHGVAPTHAGEAAFEGSPA